MSKPVSAHKRGDSIAVTFENGVANEFSRRLGENATWSLVCFDGREVGWDPMDLDDARRIADECGLVWCGDE